AAGQRDLGRSLRFVAAGVVLIGLGVIWMLYERGRPDALPAEQPATTFVSDPAQATQSTQPAASLLPPVAVQSPVDGLRTKERDVEVVVAAGGHDVLWIHGREVAVGGDGVARTTLRLATDVMTSIVIRDAGDVVVAGRDVFVDTTPPELLVELPEGARVAGD